MAWISTKERLPERTCYDGNNTQDTREGVLVWVSYKSPCPEDVRENNGWVERARLNWNGVWVEMNETGLTESTEGTRVTHWQPLPEPPETKSPSL